MLTLRHLAGCVMALVSLLMTTAIPVCAQQKSLQKGKASYYSRRIDGHKTSSGERLNNDSLVCAHRTHPFGTKLLVKNPANGKEVIVRVIDRGPFTRGRVVDLSYEAARRLGMLSAGVAMVEVSVYDDTEIPYKPKEYSMPELELEMTHRDNDITPEWQKGKNHKNGAAKEKDKSHHAEKDAKSHHTEKDVKTHHAEKDAKAAMTTDGPAMEKDAKADAGVAEKAASDVVKNKKGNTVKRKTTVKRRKATTKKKRKK